MCTFSREHISLEVVWKTTLFLFDWLQLDDTLFLGDWQVTKKKREKVVTWTERLYLVALSNYLRIWSEKLVWLWFCLWIQTRFGSQLGPELNTWVYKPCALRYTITAFREKKIPGCLGFCLNSQPCLCFLFWQSSFLTSMFGCVQHNPTEVERHFGKILCDSEEISGECKHRCRSHVSAVAYLNFAREPADATRAKLEWLTKLRACLAAHLYIYGSLNWRVFYSLKIYLACSRRPDDRLKGHFFRRS